MIKLIIGFVLGVLVTVEAGIICYCIFYEYNHPEALDKYRVEKLKINRFHGETYLQEVTKLNKRKQPQTQHSETIQIGDYTATMTFSPDSDSKAISDIKTILFGRKNISTKPSKICKKNLTYEIIRV